LVPATVITGTSKLQAERLAHVHGALERGIVPARPAPRRLQCSSQPCERVGKVHGGNAYAARPSPLVRPTAAARRSPPQPARHPAAPARRARARALTVPVVKISSWLPALVRMEMLYFWP
jgi:hypothetical protein